MLEYGGKEKEEWDGQFVPRVQYLLNFESPPEVFILHCGENNLGYVPLHTLRRQIFVAILEIIAKNKNSVVTNFAT